MVKAIKKTHLLGLAIFIYIFSILPIGANAADLSFSSIAGSYQVGKTFSLTINVNSSGEVMNGASGVFSFPSNKLEVVSISKTGSIFSLWVQEPTFSNTAGTVSFEGIVLNPGFTGYEGKIMTVTFRTKSIGDAEIKFLSGSVLANDGLGTNILKTLKPTFLTVVEKSLDQSNTSDTPIPAPAPDNYGLNIVSSTHPDQTKWYVDSSPQFSWTLPEGTEEIRTILSSLPDALPTIRYNPPITSRQVNDLEDGVYYFTIQARDADGWGPVVRYKINIDTTPPKAFTITFPHGNKTLEPQPVILFNTVDNYSGISHYNVEIGSGGPTRLASVQTSNPYPLPPQYPGTYVVSVTAFDQAGNTRTSSAEFTIDAIEKPEITFFQETLEVGDILKIRGTTYPNSEVNIYIREGDKEVTEEFTRSNSLGDFSVVVGKQLDKGQYTFTARVTDNRGAKSNETDPISVTVTSNILNDLARLAINYLSLIIIIGILIVGTVMLIIHIWSKFSYRVKKIKEESRESEIMIRKAFNLLRKDIEDHIERLNKAESNRNLTREEVLFLEKFENELGDAEKFIKEEVEKSTKANK